MAFPDHTISRQALFAECRRAFSLGGKIRWWEAGERRDSWFLDDRPDVFCDAEVLYRESDNTQAEPTLKLSARSRDGDGVRELTLVLDRVNLYRANYQIRHVLLNGQLLAIVG